MARKKNNDMQKHIVIALMVTAAIVIAWWAAATIKNSAGVEKTRKNVLAKRVGETEQLMEVVTPDALCQEVVEYTGFNVSFNADLHIPNYVVYELTCSEVQGEEPRSNKFLCDERVKGCPTTTDYTGSGYDRGHMAPAADMKWSKQAMKESFYLTNICPQNHSLNSGGWKRLEEKVRAWADRDSAIIVISGPLLDGPVSRLASGVAVPTGFFKVVLAPFVSPVRAIAFVYKNEGGQKKVELQATSVDEVEQLTGFDFFSSLPDDIETEIEKSSNYNEWNN